MRRRVSIGIGLKVDNELLSTVAVYCALNPLFYLLSDGRKLSCRIWCKRIDIAIRTTAIAFTPIAVRTSEMTVDNNLKDSFAIIFLTKIGTVVVIRLLTRI